MPYPAAQSAPTLPLTGRPTTPSRKPVFRVPSHSINRPPPKQPHPDGHLAGPLHVGLAGRPGDLPADRNGALSGSWGVRSTPVALDPSPPTAGEAGVGTSCRGVERPIRVSVAHFIQLGLDSRYPGLDLMQGRATNRRCSPATSRHSSSIKWARAGPLRQRRLGNMHWPLPAGH